MTWQEYDKQAKVILENVHPKLAEVLNWVAYEEGHAYGYVEVLLDLKRLVEDFREVNNILLDHLGCKK